MMLFGISKWYVMICQIASTPGPGAIAQIALSIISAVDETGVARFFLK